MMHWDMQEEGPSFWWDIPGRKKDPFPTSKDQLSPSPLPRKKNRGAMVCVLECSWGTVSVS